MEEHNIWVTDIQDAYAQFKLDQESIKKESNTNTALKLAIKYGLEDGDKVLKGLEVFIKAIGEGTESEMELKALRHSQKPKGHVPDSGIRSGTAGKDTGKMSASELLEHGFKEINK